MGDQRFIMIKLKAGSLLESVLALSLLAGALATGIWIHARTLGTDRSGAMLQAWGASEHLLSDPLLRADIDGPFIMDGFEITMEQQELSRHLVRVTLTCRRAGRPILQRHTIRPVP